MRFLSVNADCFLIELDSLEETLALYNKLHTMQLNGIKDLVPAAKTILVFFNEIETTFKTLGTSIQTVKIGSGVERNVQELIIPICYTGEDLAQVAALQGLSIADVILKHRQSVWNVAFIGFAPGFAYLGGLPDALHVSRRNSPRAPHPANAIMIGGGMSAIASVPMPTGWWVIGRTPEKMFAPGRNPEFLVAVGDDIRFEPVNSATFTALETRCRNGEIIARAEAKR